MIFECFPFSEELDLLEIRLRLLEGVVDYFVLCEAPWTFRGDPKRLAYAESGERFARWRSKIVHVVYPGPPTPDPWHNDWEQRNYLATGLAGRANPDDLILLSDCDEIPHPDNVARRPRERLLLGHKQQRSHGYFNRVASEPWFGTRAFLWSSFPRYGSMMEVRRRPESQLELVDGGWHFSSLGGPEIVHKKMRSYAHSEFDIPYLTDSHRLVVRHRSEGEGKWVPLDDSFPALFREARWKQYVWDGATLDERMSGALEHAHGCFAYVPDDAIAVAVVANENATAWQTAGNERFNERFAGVFARSKALPANFPARGWIVTDVLDDDVFSRDSGIVTFVTNARSFSEFERIFDGQAFPAGPALGAREWRARLESEGRTPDRVDRLQRGGVFAPPEKLPQVMYEVVLGTVLRIDEITREELTDFLAKAMILRWEPRNG